MHITTTAATSAVTAAVSQQARRLIHSSVSANTRRSYKTALRMLDNWAGDKPLTDALLADYIGGKFADGKSPATLRLAVAAVNFRARMTGSDSPVGILTTAALAGAVRAGAGRGRGQAQPIRWAQADAVSAVAAADGSLRGVRDSAVCAIMSDGLLRISETAALRVDDFTTESDGSGRLRIRVSKTDSSGKGVVLFIRARTVNAVQSWLRAAGIVDGRLFRSVNRHGGVGNSISTRSLTRIIKRRAINAGAGNASGHSFRVGSAQSLVSAGAPLPALMQAGRWQSASTAARYAAGQLAATGAVASLRPA